MSTSYAAYAKQFTARLQARMHNQSYGRVALKAHQLQSTPAGSIADSRLRELERLVEEHKRTFDPTFKRQALSILQTMPLKSVSEDPVFLHTFAGLRACAHFHAHNAPATFNFINHVTSHTFLLDGRAVFQFFTILDFLHHPQSAEIIQIVLPRVREIVDDLSVSEARRVLEFLAKEKALDADLCDRLTAVMQGSLQDLTVKELAWCVSDIHLMTTQECARRFFTAAAPRICQVLRDSVAQRHYYTSLQQLAPDAVDGGAATSSPNDAPANTSAIVRAEGTSSHPTMAQIQQFVIEEQRAVAHLLFELPRAIAFLAWGPRSVLNEMVRTAIAWSEPQERAPTLAAEEEGEDATSVMADTATTASLSLPQDDRAQSRAQKGRGDVCLEPLPYLHRFQLSNVLKALHYASYRHPAGLRLLCARVALVGPTVGAALSSHVRDDLSLAVEAAAYFYALDCIPVILTIVEEMETTQLAPMVESVTKRMASKAVTAHVLTREESKATETILVRTLLSCARLLSACADGAAKPAGTPGPVPGCVVDPAVKRELCVRMVALSTSPLLRLYLNNAQQLLRQRDAAPSPVARRHFAGAVHTLNSILVLFSSITEDRAADKFDAAAAALMSVAAFTTLRGYVGELVQLVQVVAERQSGNLSQEIVAEARLALQLAQSHPEWI